MVDGSAPGAEVGFMRCPGVLPAMPGDGMQTTEVVYSVSTRIITPLAICHGPIARSGPSHAHPLHAERHEEPSTMDDVTQRAARTQKMRPRLDFQDHLADLEARGLLLRLH